MGGLAGGRAVLIAALILAVIGLAALVAAVATGNELIAWVCIGASGLGILLLIVDAIRERTHRQTESPAAASAHAGVIEAVETTETGETTETLEPVIEPVIDDSEADRPVANQPDEPVHDDEAEPYSQGAESAEIEQVDTGDSDVSDERRDD